RGRGPLARARAHGVRAGHADGGLVHAAPRLAGADDDLLPRPRGEPVRVLGVRAVGLRARGRDRARGLRAPGHLGTVAPDGRPGRGPRRRGREGCAAGRRPLGGSARNRGRAGRVPVRALGPTPWRTRPGGATLWLWVGRTRGLPGGG